MSYWKGVAYDLSNLSIEGYNCFKLFENTVYVQSTYVAQIILSWLKLPNSTNMSKGCSSTSWVHKKASRGWLGSNGRAGYPIKPSGSKRPNRSIEPSCSKESRRPEESSSSMETNRTKKSSSSIETSRSKKSSSLKEASSSKESSRSIIPSNSHIFQARVEEVAPCEPHRTPSPICLLPWTASIIPSWLLHAYILYVNWIWCGLRNDAGKSAKGARATREPQIPQLCFRRLECSE